MDHAIFRPLDALDCLDNHYHLKPGFLRRNDQEKCPGSTSRGSTFSDWVAMQKTHKADRFHGFDIGPG